MMEVAKVNGVPEFNDEEIYKNFTAPKGLALIFNNRKFDQKSKLKERTGTDVDTGNISVLLKNLGYDVKIQTDLSSGEMIRALYQFSQKQKHKILDSAIVFVLSHGERGAFYGTDGVPVEIEKFVAILDSNKCQNLCGKPKLFFIQACRGDKLDAPDSADGLTLPDCKELFQTVCDGPEVVPALADTFIAYSTTPGYMSWRNEGRGSWFIQAIWETFSKKAAYDDLLSMMTKVNRLVSQKISSSGYKQIPEPCSRLRKKFYFFPGYNHDKQPLEKVFPTELIPQSKLIKSFKEDLRRFYQTFSLQNLLPLDPSSLMVPLEDMWIDLETCFKQESPSTDFRACLSKARAWGYPVFVQGAPGSGKSTLVKKLCYAWAQTPSELPEFDVVLMAQLRDVKKAKTLEELCLQWLAQKCFIPSDKQASLSEEIGEMSPDQVLIVLDGLDENIPSCPQLDQLFQYDSVPFKFPVVITTRPYKTFDIDIKTRHHSCNIMGLSLPQQIDYIQKFFAAQNKNTNETERFIEHLISNRNLQTASSTPLLLQMSLASGYFTLHHRQTDLYTAMCSVLAVTHGKSHVGCSIEPTNWMHHKSVKQLCHLAFDRLVECDEDGLNFSEVDLILSGITAEQAKIGFLTRKTSIDYVSCQEKVSYAFLHKTVQEFFAALYLLHDINEANSSFSQFMEKLENDFLLRIQCQQQIIFLFGLLCSRMPKQVDKLLTIISMEIYPYITENVVFLTELRNECVSLEQKDMINRKIIQLFSIGWADISIKHLLSHDLFSIEELSKGIFHWTNTAALSGCEVPAQLNYLVYDGSIANSTAIDAELRFKMKTYGSVFYSGPESRIHRLAQHLSQNTQVMKLHLSLPAAVNGQSWHKFDKLHHLTISVAEGMFPVLQLGSVKALIASAPKLTSLALLNCSDMETFSGLEQLPSTMRKFKLKNSKISSQAVDILSTQLSYWKSLETFNFYKCHIRAECVFQLLKALGPSVNNLNISGIPIPVLFEKQRLCQLASQIQCFQELKLLSLRNCGLTDSGIPALMEVLPQCLKLKFLLLGWNKISLTKQKELIQSCKMRNIQVFFGFIKQWDVSAGRDTTDSGDNPGTRNLDNHEELLQYLRTISR